MPRAPLPGVGVTHRQGDSKVTSEGITPPSSLLRAHAPHHPPRAAFGSLIPRVLAGCGEPLLDDGGSRRYLCVSVPRCLDPYPGGVVGAPTHYFPTTIGLPPVLMGRLPASIRSATSEREVMSELQSFTHVQASRFATTQVAPTAVPARGSRGVYVRAAHQSLPSGASDMLAVRMGN